MRGIKRDKQTEKEILKRTRESHTGQDGRGQIEIMGGEESNIQRERRMNKGKL